MNEIQLKQQAAERQPQFWWHWQNLNEDREGNPKGSAFWAGRAWWHFAGEPNRYAKVIRLEWITGKLRFGFGVDFDDEDITIQMAIPLISLYLSFGQGWNWVRRISPHCVLSPNYPDTIVVDRRTCSVTIYDWTMRISPWSKTMEWASADPWWVKGVSLSLNPFEWKFRSHEERRSDGAWILVPSWKLGEGQPKSQAEVMTFPYTYVPKSGEVQNRTATVTVERRTWYPRCLRFTTLFDKVRPVIDVKFSDEVGERSGSWKGGCTGCGYDLLPGESAESCLRRMESERKF